MKTTTLCLALVLMSTALIAMPTAAADTDIPCRPSDGSTVNRVQYMAGCYVDRTQEWLDEVVCGLICP